MLIPWLIRGRCMTERHRRRPRPNDERDRKIVAMVEGGATLRQTAEAFNLSRARIQQIISVRGVQAGEGRQELSPLRPRVVEMVAKGMSMRQVGAELGISGTRVGQLYHDEMERRGMEG